MRGKRMEYNKIIQGDCVEVLKTMPDNCIDTIITDPPYGLGFMGKQWDTFDKNQFGKAGEEGQNDLKVKKNFNILPRYKTDGLYDFTKNWAKECLRVLKPGGTALIFAGSRTQHKIACGVEDAGFILFDTITWLYGSGFPKSTSIYKQLNKKGICGIMVVYEKTKSNSKTNEKKTSRTTEEEYSSKYPLRFMWKTNISQTFNIEKKQGEILQSGLQKQSLQIQQSQSTDNVRQRQSSLERWGYIQTNERELQRCKVCALSERIFINGEEGWLCNGTPFSDSKAYWKMLKENRMCPSYRPQSTQQQNIQSDIIPKQYNTQEIRGDAEEWKGWGTHLKPAFEPIICARKPNEGSYANNALKWGVAGLNIDGGRIPYEEGGNIASNPLLRKNSGAKIMCGNDNNGTSFKIKPYPMKMNITAKGRFPANIILDETYIQLLTLKGNCDKIIEKTIGEYYDNYEVPSMWKRVPDLPEQSERWEREVLQQKVLLESSKKLPTTNAREKTQREVVRENEAEQEEYTEGEGKQKISGLVLQQGVQEHKLRRTKPKGIKDSKTDDWQRGDIRTQINNGNENGQIIKEKRNSSSQERDKERQQDREFRDNQQYQSYTNSFQIDREEQGINKGERKIEILISDIPSQWLKYFEPTGFSIIDPNSSGRLLDEQSGVLKTGGRNINSHSEQNKSSFIFKGTEYEGYNQHDRQGGASRFFYCAKSSKAERNRGCEGLEEKQVNDGRNKLPDNAYQRGKSFRSNTHPTVKPLSLMKYLCTITKTPTGGIVLDPFCGSGTTLMACKETGRDYIGIEKDKEYVEIARKRIKAIPETLF